MKKTISIFILLWSSLLLHAQETVIRNVNVIDVKSGKVSSNYAVAITNGKISWIGDDKKLKLSGQTRVVDGTGKYLSPGLIDSHIHFFQSGGIYTRPDALDLRSKVPYEKELEFGLNNAGDYLTRYLRLGITTVMDVGGPLANFAVRDSISKKMLSPNVLVTGPLFSIVDRPQLDKGDPPIVKITGQADIDALFTKMLPYKPDFIKIWYIATAQYPAEKSFPLVKAVGDQAAKNKLRLAVHSTQLKTARLAVDAGATILVHSVDDEIIPDDFVKTLKKKGVTYIPTLIVGGNYGIAFSGKLPNHPQDLEFANAFAYGTLSDPESMEESELPSNMKALRQGGIPKSKPNRDSISAVNLKKLYKAGVNIATGTDAGNIGTFHASSYLQELEAMNRAGLTPSEILKCSTINPAMGFDIGNKVGSIEVNKTADLVLLSKNPLLAVENLNSIGLVIKGGVFVRADTLLHEAPEATVQRQVNAYNGRNIDMFLATYSDEIEIFDNNGKSLLKGKEEMRTRYEGLFKHTPDLHCHIEKRVVEGNKITDNEKVRVNGKPFHATAIYEVEKGKIRKVTFVN